MAKSKRRLYIAYGSNLNLEKMRQRCPTAKVVGAGVVRNWRLLFRVVATIEQCKGKQVPVLIWDIQPQDEAALDIYEGYPYIGIRKRHPLNCRRSTVITGKYKGSVFCKLEEDFDCLCKYSEYHRDDDFQIGDKVIIVVKKYNDKTQRVFGVIVSKWN
jgi:uncharacterized protein YozE (UPF0346 family)